MKEKEREEMKEKVAAAATPPALPKLLKQVSPCTFSVTIPLSKFLHIDPKEGEKERGRGPPCPRPSSRKREAR